MQHIETLTVGVTPQAAIEFLSIPDTFTDLYLVVSLRSTQAGFAFDDIAIQFNGDTLSSNYSNRGLRTREGTVGSFTGAHIQIYGVTAAAATANTFGSGQACIPNYRSGVAKSVSAEGYSENNNATLVQGGLIAGRWSGTDPITSLKIYSLNGWTFGQYSSASLYGILAGSDGTTVVS
jgi:hypothetical protein